MMQDQDTFWSDAYNAGRDYRQLPTAALNEMLTLCGLVARNTALDLGCGTGMLSRELYHRGFREIVGVDISTSAVRVAQASTVVQGLSYKRVNIETELITTFRGKSFDLIMCKLVLAFVKDKPAFFETIKQLLSPQGKFVVISPLLKHVPVERQAIAISLEDVELLSRHFKQTAAYEQDQLYHFIGS